MREYSKEEVEKWKMKIIEYSKGEKPDKRSIIVKIFDKEIEFRSV